MELLAKCFYNSSIKSLVDALLEVIQGDEKLCVEFMKGCWEDDQWKYLFEVMLDCTDSTTRLHVGTLLKTIINKLKSIEKDYLFVQETVTTISEKGDKYSYQ